MFKFIPLNKNFFIFLPDAAIGIFFLYFPLQNSENKVSILTKSGKIYHSHTRGMGSPTCRSVLLGKKYPKSSLM
jgi:hypothetical protein